MLQLHLVCFLTVTHTKCVGKNTRTVNIELLVISLRILPCTLAMHVSRICKGRWHAFVCDSFRWIYFPGICPPSFFNLCKFLACVLCGIIICISCAYSLLWNNTVPWHVFTTFLLQEVPMKTAKEVRPSLSFLLALGLKFGQRIFLQSVTFLPSPGS